MNEEFKDDYRNCPCIHLHWKRWRTYRSFRGGNETSGTLSYVFFFSGTSAYRVHGEEMNSRAMLGESEILRRHNPFKF